MSPAFANKRLPSLAQWAGILTALVFNPAVEFKLPFTSSDCTRDRDYIKTLDSDPREYRKIPAKLILEIMLSQARAGMMKKRMPVPVLFLIAGSDRIVDSRRAISVLNGLDAEDKALAEFPEMYHSLSVDTGREVVFEEMMMWIRGRIA